MTRKLSICIALLVTALVLTGASFATVVPTVILFGGPITSGAIAVGPNSAVFSSAPAVQGYAAQAGAPGTFTLSGATVHLTSGHATTLAPNSQVFTVTIGQNSLTGNLTLVGMTPLVFNNINFGTAFGGVLDITQSTWGFLQTGFPVNSQVLVDFTIQPNGQFSSGEVAPDPVPEPGMMVLFGSGLLAAAGMLRRRA